MDIITINLIFAFVTVVNMNHGFILQVLQYLYQQYLIFLRVFGKFIGQLLVKNV